MNPMSSEYSKKFWGKDTPAGKIMKERSPMNKVREGRDYDTIKISKTEKDAFHIPDCKIRFDS